MGWAAILLLLAIAVILLLRRPAIVVQPAPPGLSPVIQQHLELYPQGTLSPVALEASKAELRAVLGKGGIPAVESLLRPGREYVVHVQALQELGGEEAAVLLQRQLARRITPDPLEQGWYWYDVVRALRDLNPPEVLTLVFRASHTLLATPLGGLIAGEIVAFEDFGDALHDPLSSRGYAALRALHAALEGVRTGRLPLSIYAEAQIGEIIRGLAEECPDITDPLLARVFLEALRHGRRVSHAVHDGDHYADLQREVRWQAAFFRDAEPVLREYLHDIGDDLARSLLYVTRTEQVDVLGALMDLRAEAGGPILRLLAEPGFQARPAAIRCLAWSKDIRVGGVLCEMAKMIHSRSLRGNRIWGLGGLAPDSKLDLQAILFALRSHPSEEAETILRRHAVSLDQENRLSAIGSLGWWEPIARTEVIAVLQKTRRDQDPVLRQAACAALARLGDCSILQVLTDSLGCDEADRIHEAINLVVNEHLTYLVGEVDALTESSNGSVAAHAVDAVERLRETILGPLN